MQLAVVGSGILLVGVLRYDIGYFDVEVFLLTLQRYVLFSQECVMYSSPRTTMGRF